MARARHRGGTAERRNGGRRLRRSFSILWRCFDGVANAPAANARAFHSPGVRFIALPGELLARGCEIIAAVRNSNVGAGRLPDFYDPAGNRTTLTYPGSKVVTYTYDEVGSMTAVKDWDNRTSN